jgi:hypothetical protein
MDQKADLEHQSTKYFSPQLVIVKEQSSIVNPARLWHTWYFLGETKLVCNKAWTNWIALVFIR